MSVRSRRRSTVAALLASGVLAAPLVAVPAAAAGGGSLSTVLTGAAEVPGPGDPDGSGSATVRVNVGKRQVCVDLVVSGIAPATGAHIHQAPAGAAGPIVVPLVPPTSGASRSCHTVDKDLAKDIRKSPEDYYVNVHNAEFPAGALRGQLG